MTPSWGAHTTEGRDAIQRDLGRLEKWTHKNLKSFSKAKLDQALDSLI